MAGLTTPAVMAAGAVCCHGIRSQDEIVVVNTRMLCGCCCDDEALRSGLVFENYAFNDDSGCRQWLPSDLESFLAFDPTVRTVFFVHGNQVTSGEAKYEGLAVYRRLVQCADSDVPIRFVIFSWPSAKVRGLLNDVRVKAARTGPAGCQLAWLLDQLDADTPVGLIGFSFGARIITGALHILAGGTLNGMGLADQTQLDRAPMEVVLIAAALHAHWLGDGQYHGLAMTKVSRMLLLNNCQDWAMRHYRFITPHGNPQALGLRGPTYIAPDQAAKIQMRDLSCYVGSQHELFRYLSAPGISAQLWDYASGGVLAY